MSASNSGVERLQPFVRFVRLNGNQVPADPVSVDAGANNDFIVSLNPPVPAAPAITWAVFNLSDGSQVGTTKNAGDVNSRVVLFTIPTGDVTLTAGGIQYILRVSLNNPNVSAMCEIELTTQ